MSFWAKIENVNITNLKAFADACKELNLDFVSSNNEVYRGEVTTHKITDTEARNAYCNYAYLISNLEHSHSIYGDADEKYSSLAKRFGKNFGGLKQAYLKHDIVDRARQNNLRVMETKNNSDGSISLRIIKS